MVLSDFPDASASSAFVMDGDCFSRESSISSASVIPPFIPPLFGGIFLSSLENSSVKAVSLTPWCVCLPPEKGGVGMISSDTARIHFLKTSE